MHASMTLPVDANSSIGIFDSGIGGLSVLRHILACLPTEQLLYFADSGYAPYGDKSQADIEARSLSIAAFMVARGIKALVVACNTATAAAITRIRATWPTLIVVGIEPGLKPATLLSKTRVIGVLATYSTLASTRFMTLCEQLPSDVRVLPQACIGLADCIEKGELNTSATQQLVAHYVLPLLKQGADTLVLGCTHYPFVSNLITDVAIRNGYPVPHIIDTGEAIARQLIRLLDSANLRSPTKAALSAAADTEQALHTQQWQLQEPLSSPKEPSPHVNDKICAFTSASASPLLTAFTQLLQLSPYVSEIRD